MTATVSVHRPRFEGANIRTWIGFKQFMYLVEDCVLDWLRTNALGAWQLYHEYGLGVEIVDCSVQLPAVLEVDDEVRAEVRALAPRRFAVMLRALRDGAEVTVAKGKVTVALVREVDAPTRRTLVNDLLPAPVDRIEAAAQPGPQDAFSWDWRASYFYCHFSDRVQHSGYVRALEEVVDRFLDSRGISVGRLLRDRGWIPVVSRARMQILAAAHMEEVVHTTFLVDDIMRGKLFDGRMDCYVRRDDQVVHTATARILHGYAISRGPDAGQPATLDDEVIAALTGGGAR